MVQFAGDILTAESIAAARQWYADNFRVMQADAESGRVTVNNLANYRAWCERCAEQALTSERLSFALLQRAHYIQTGKCVALLP